MAESRFCNTCQTEKPGAAFYPSYKTQCKACLKSKAAPQRAAKIAYLAEWRRQHPGAHQAWYQQNKPNRRAYWQRWRPAHAERLRKKYRQWAKANPDKVNALIAKRNAAKAKATPAWADHVAIRAMYSRAVRLTKETGIRHEVDHIVPLRSSIVCGLHVESNLQILTSAENKKKSNRLQIPAVNIRC